MIGLPFDIPTITHVQWLQILVAISVPYVMYRITKMSTVLKWTDIIVAIGLSMTPFVVILGFQGILDGASIVGILSAIMLNSLGAIVVD
ncbi:hypothetical protein ACFQH6_04675 [Halobacteriaceae archaeon GCM10025711]